MMFKITLRNVAAHKLRLLLSAIAVLLGVAFVAGTLIFTDTMSKQFDDLFARIGKGVAVDVRGKTVVEAGGEQHDGLPTAQAVPASLLETLRKVDGVRDPIGNVTGYAAVIGKDGKVVGTMGPPQFGGNWVEGGDYDLRSGVAPKGPDQVVIDEQTATKAGYRVGDQAKILFQGPTRPMRVVGIIDAGNLMGATYAAFDTATAQQLLLKPGYFTDIQMGSTGPSEAVLRDRVAKVLPGNVEAITGTKLRDDAKSDIASMMSFFRIFLLIFALISIFVGAFIIFNTFSMLVAQRTRELALIRAVGASRKQVTRAVLGEAVALGLIGSTLGLAAGAGLAKLLQSLFDTGEGSALVFTATPVIWSYAVGVLVTVAAAYFPARRAAKIPPVAAMRDDIAMPQRSLRIRVMAGAGLTAVGAVLSGFGIAGAGPKPLALLGAGAVAVFLGIAMLAPVISRPVIRALGAPLPRLFRTPGRMARENALRNPRRTATTAAALMIGLALVSAISVLSSSMSASIAKSVDTQFGVDYAVQADGGREFSPSAVDAVAKTPGVEQATPVYQGRLNIDGEPTSYLAGDSQAITTGLRVSVRSGTARLSADELLIDEDVAKAEKLSVGGSVAVQFADGAKATLRVAGIYPKGMLGPRLLPGELHLRHTTTPRAAMALVNVRTADTATKQAIERSLADYPNVRVQDQSDVKKQAQEQINQLVALLTMLLALSIIIAAVGVINTLALSVIERTREIGLLRAVGTSRRQLRRMIRLESVMIAVFGAVLGIGIGITFGAGIQQGLADDGLDVLDIPMGTLVLYVVLAALIGVLAALWPAWRAGRMDVLKAIATE